jgi:ribosomal protein S18 acetylase RimI-like enzyme
MEDRMSRTYEAIVAPATPADATALAGLINTSYRAQGKAAGWTHEAGLLAGARTSADGLTRVLATGEATILLMRRKMDAKLVGCISVEPMADARCYLSLLAIDPDDQDCGYGRLLLAQAETFGRARGARTARMTVIRQRETLIAWYQRRGYRRTGEVLSFPYDDPNVGKPLRDDLQLIVLERPLADRDAGEACGVSSRSFAWKRTEQR